MAVLASLGAAAGAGGGISFGSILGGIGTVVSAISQSNAANFQAAIDQQNADIANQNAIDTVAKSQEDQLALDLENAAIMDEQLALMGGSGISAGSGSSQLKRKSAKKLARKDATNLRDAGNQQADNFKQQQANFLNSKTLSKKRASSALVGGFLKGATSILGSSKSFSGSSRIRSRKF